MGPPSIDLQHAKSTKTEYHFGNSPEWRWSDGRGLLMTASQNPCRDSSKISNLNRVYACCGAVPSPAG